MANTWALRGRPVLFNALAAACDTIEKDVLAEQERRQSELIADLSVQLQSERDRVHTLKEEIQTLHAQLAAQSRPLALSSAASIIDPTGELEPVLHDNNANPNTPVHDPSDDHEEHLRTLQKKHRALRAQFLRSVSLLRHRTKSRKEWIRYAEDLEAQLGQHHKNETGRAARPDTDDGAPKRTAEEIRTMNGTLQEPPPKSDRSFFGAVPKPSQDEEDHDIIAALGIGNDIILHYESEEIPLPDLPVPNAQAKVRVKQEPLSDEPVIVSERIIRKRKLEDVTDSEPRRIKHEEDSPDHIRSDSTSASLDLDGSDGCLTTPRKDRGSDQFDTPCPPGGHIHQPRLVQTEVQQNLVLPLDVISTVANTYRRGPVSAPTTTSGKRAIAKPDPATDSKIAYMKRPALESLSSNRSTVTRTDIPFKKPRKDLDRSVWSLAEDSPNKSSENLAHREGSPIPGRLQTLLNKTAAKGADKDTTLSAPWTRPEQSGPFDKAGMGPSRSHTRNRLTLGDDTTAASLQQLGLHGQAKEPGKISGTSSEPTDRGLNRHRIGDKRGSAAPLRSTPASDLHLDDFKVNPKFNNGYDFAFSEVVRDKSERTKLPGCTDPKCCGNEFRAMALDEKPKHPLSAQQKADERRLLEDFLGERVGMLPSLGPVERDEIWIRAKTAELASKFGKHKHRFARARSPEGFWNPDMEDTQELQRQKEAAACRERDTIVERYREAMRHNGRYVFRDE